MEQNDKQLIVDCLLFSASVQICANWDEEKQTRMVELAKTIGAQPSKDIEFYADDYELEEPWASQIPKHFDIELTGVEPPEENDQELKGSATSDGDKEGD
jgi:hypothetical protein